MEDHVEIPLLEQKAAEENPPETTADAQKIPPITQAELKHHLCQLTQKSTASGFDHIVFTTFVTENLEAFLDLLMSVRGLTSLTDRRYHPLFHALAGCSPEEKETLLHGFLLDNLECYAAWSPAFIQAKQGLFQILHQNLAVYGQSLLDSSVNESAENGVLLCNWIYATLHYPELADALPSRFGLAFEDIRMYGNDALQHAIEYEYAEVVDHLLEDPRQFFIETISTAEGQNRLTRLPLQSAIEAYKARGYHERLRVNCLSSDDPAQAVFRQGYQARVHILSLLLHKGAQTDLNDVQNAISYSNLEMLKTLLLHIPPERMHEGGMNVLMDALEGELDWLLQDRPDYALLKESYQAIVHRILSLLLQNGANPNQAKSGNTPLQSALRRRTHPSIVQLLLEHGADPAPLQSRKEEVDVDLEYHYLIAQQERIQQDRNLASRNALPPPSLSTCLEKLNRWAGADPIRQSAMRWVKHKAGACENDPFHIALLVAAVERTFYGVRLPIKPHTPAGEMASEEGAFFEATREQKISQPLCFQSACFQLTHLARYKADNARDKQRADALFTRNIPLLRRALARTCAIPADFSAEVDLRYLDLEQELGNWSGPYQQAVLDGFLLDYLECYLPWSPYLIQVKEALMERMLLYIEVYGRQDKRHQASVEEVGSLNKRGILLCNWLYMYPRYPLLATALLSRFSIRFAQICRHSNAALELAIACRYVDVITALLEDPVQFYIDIERKNKEGLTPLQLAVQDYALARRAYGDISVILALLKGGANPAPALMTAIEYRTLDIIKTLLQYEVDLEWRDQENRTPFFLAAENAAEILVQVENKNTAQETWKSASFFARSPKGKWILSPKHIEILDLLLAAGAKPDVEGRGGVSLVTYETLWDAMGTDMLTLRMHYYFSKTYRVVKAIYGDNLDRTPDYLLSAYIAHLKKLEDRWLNKIAGLDKTLIAWVEKKAAECENDALKIAALVAAVQNMCPDIQFAPTTKTVDPVAQAEAAPPVRMVQEEKDPISTGPSGFFQQEGRSPADNLPAVPPEVTKEKKTPSSFVKLPDSAPSFFDSIWPRASENNPSAALLKKAKGTVPLLDPRSDPQDNTGIGNLEL